MPPLPSPNHRFPAVLALVTLVAAATAATATGAPRIQLLVRPVPNASPAALRRVERAAGAKRDGRLRSLGVDALTVAPARATAALRVLRRSALVEFAERDAATLELGAGSRLVVPTDPLWSREWGLRSINAPRAWQATQGSPGVVIATLDSGVDFSHPDLSGALVPGHNVVDANAAPSDDNGHGTAVAGLIAARADNGLGISGICPRCSLMPVKVTTAAGTATDSAVANGLTWAVDHGARVVNISLGGTAFSQTIDAAVRYAVAKGAVVVSSAGNSGTSSAFYPAADDAVVGVAATDARDRLYSWSNYGSWVDAAAPGCGFTTALGGLYEQFCGTSASAPIVSGLIGLALSAASDGAAVIDAVARTGRPVTGIAWGRVDAAATLARLMRARSAGPHYRGVRAALRLRAVEVRRGRS